MLEPRAPARSFPAYLAERRAGLAERLADRSTPTEAMHAVRELLDELLTIELSERSTRERQIGERALRIVGDTLGFLRVVRATAHWSHPVGSGPRRPGRPWRVLGLVAVQVLVGLGLAWLLAGVLQRGAVGGDGSLAFALLLVAGLLVLQALTGYQLLVRRRAGPSAVDDRPEIGLSVDGDGLMTALSRALLAVDQLEQVAAAPPEPTAPNRAGLADYPELLRAIQQVYAARLSVDPRRAQQRAEALRASLEQYGVRFHDEWTESEPPPPDLFMTQRSLDPSSTEYRVILPAVADAHGVILPGRIAVPAVEVGRRSARPGRAEGGGEPPR